MITHPQSEVTIFEVQLVRVTVIMEVLRPRVIMTEVLRPRVIVIMRTACMPHGAVACTCGWHRVWKQAAAFHALD